MKLVLFPRAALVRGSLLLLGVVANGDCQAALRGVVRSDSGRAFITGAEISIGTLGRTVRSTESGRYLLDRLPVGSYQVVARAIGFEPKAVPITIESSDTTELDFSLSAVAVEIPGMQVRTLSAFRSGKMADFDRRRRLGFGTFIDREELSREEDQPLSIALRSVLSVRLVARPQACGGGFAAASGRGGSMGSGLGGGGQSLHCFSDPKYLFVPACYLALYVDGARIWAWDSAEPPNLDDYVASGLEGIEVYRGSSELPTELNATGNQCGAILLWTRTGDAEVLSDKEASSNA